MKWQRDLKLNIETIQVILSSMKEWKKPEWTRILCQLHNKNCDDEMCIIKSIREANIATQTYTIVSELHDMPSAAMCRAIQGLLWLWVRPQGIELEKTWNLHAQERPGPEQTTQITDIAAAIRWLHFLSHSLSVPEIQTQSCLVSQPTCRSHKYSQRSHPPVPTYCVDLSSQYNTD